MDRQLIRLHLGLPAFGQPEAMLALSFAVIAAILSTSSSQRTYVRSCDCEYTVNGKCAYTLLLPIYNGSGANAVGACDASSSSSSSTSAAVSNLHANVSYLLTWSHETTRLISQLQGILLSLTAGNDSSTCRSGGCSDVVVTAAVEKQAADIANVTTSLAGLTANVRALNYAMTSLSVNVSGLQQAIANQKLKIDTLTAEVLMLTEWTCQKRSRLFSGPSQLIDGSVSFSSVYSDTFTSMNQFAIDSSSAWCPGKSNAD